ncbi:MAG: FMN-binding protein [Candidatus Omnitrophica bacterium]|nr:FMN-binding protein [Candidatus Omnitrophota bacterium]
MRVSHWSRILAGLTVMAPIPYVAYAEVYMTENQAAEILFPGLKLQSSWIDLTPQEIKAVERASGKKWLSPHIHVWWGPNHEAVVIDRVVGKHEFITYAVAITPEAQVKGIEIIEYKETYGYQVRQPQWRNQFVGKSVHNTLKVNKDISNISGATLSCVHITDGVRRVLNTYEILKSKSQTS